MFDDNGWWKRDFVRKGEAVKGNTRRGEGVEERTRRGEEVKGRPAIKIAIFARHVPMLWSKGHYFWT